MPTSGDLSVLIFKLEDEDEAAGENWLSLRSEILDEESEIDKYN